MLTHDDHDSHYVVSRLHENQWSERSYKAGSLADITFFPDDAYYFTRNGFAGRHRRTDEARQVNALMFDIDCHGSNPRASVSLVIAALSNAFAGGHMPLPSLQVDTGRGVQLYYVLEKATPCKTKGGTANSKGLDFVRDVEAGLSDRFKEIVSGIKGAEVDESVYDLARVGRIPGTWNPKANRPAQLIGHSFAFHTLGSLLTYRRTANTAPKRTSARVIMFNRLMTLRLKNLEKLQRLRGYNCHGTRESMCFVHYNTATQIYGPDAAFAHTMAFNAQFTHPLPEADIAQIKRSVDRVVIQFGSHKGEMGFYPLRLENLIEKLRMTQQEAENAGFFDNSRQAKRQQAKTDTAQKRQARNVRIVQLFEQGKLTQQQIADESGCSLRTVSSVVNAWKTQNNKSGRSAVLLRDLAATALNTSGDNYANNCPTGWSVVSLLPREVASLAPKKTSSEALSFSYFAKNDTPKAPGPICVPIVLPIQVASR